MQTDRRFASAADRQDVRGTSGNYKWLQTFLRPKGLFYDRRKNYYKNERKPRAKIVGIPHLAQAVMAVVLKKPDVARGRPSSLLKKDEDYAKVYSESYPIQLYYVCAEAIRRVEARLKSTEADLPSKDRNNLRFYVLLHVLAQLSGSAELGPKAVAGLDPTTIDDSAIDASLKVVRAEYDKLDGTDQVAKGSSLRVAVLATL